MILVAGSANLDFVVRADHIPQPGETVLGDAFQTFAGGKGANQAVACARAGNAETHFLAAMGNDAYAQPIEQSLTDAGVRLQVVRSSTHPTGCAFICVAATGENAITVAPGANTELTIDHLPSLAGTSHLLLQLETPMRTVLDYARAARQQGVTVVLNAAPAQELPTELLAQVDILVVNEVELATVAQHAGSIYECLQRIRVPTVVVTLGDKGYCWRHHDAMAVHSAFVVDAIDTTAAGDTFCGTLVAKLSEGIPLEQALQTASAAAALACTTMGAQSSIPHAEQVASFLTQYGTHTHPSPTALLHFCGIT